MRSEHIGCAREINCCPTAMAAITLTCLFARHRAPRTKAHSVRSQALGWLDAKPHLYSCDDAAVPLYCMDFLHGLGDSEFRAEKVQIHSFKVQIGNVLSC